MSEFVTNCDKFEKENGVNETVNEIAMDLTTLVG